MNDRGQVSGEGAYVRYEMWLRGLETRVNSLVGLSGSFFAARRDVCRCWAPDRQSDFNTVLNAVVLGLRGVQDTRSIGYYRDIVDRRREFGRKVRTVVRGLFVLSSTPGMLNPLRFGLFSWQLASHKLCRWLVPFAMIAALITGAALARRSWVYAAWTASQGVFYLAALAGIATGHRALRIPAFFVVANASVFVAWLRFIRGDRIVSWTPSERVEALPQIGSTGAKSNEVLG